MWGVNVVTMDMEGIEYVEPESVLYETQADAEAAADAMAIEEMADIFHVFEVDE